MSSRRAPEVPAAATSRSAKSARAIRHQAPRAYNPGKTVRKSSKPLDSGARVEVELERLLNSKRVNPNSTDLVVWRRPGVKSPRPSGINYHPDAGGIVPELLGRLPAREANIKGRPEYNVVFEFKSQHTGGSVDKKIQAAITDLADFCDVKGVVGALILDTPALSDRQIVEFKVWGNRHSVVVMTRGEVRAGLLIPALIESAAERKRLKRRLTPRGAYTPTKRPSKAEEGFGERVNHRRDLERAMRKVERMGGVIR